MYRKTCECGIEFETPIYRQRKHAKDCGRPAALKHKARHHRLFAGLEFVGVDGEGVTRPDGNHEYVMLSVGQETLVNPNGTELSCGQIFEFLYARYQKAPHSCFVGFFLKYDFIQWTKSLPEKVAYQLWDKTAQARRKPSQRKNPDPFPVVYQGWEFDILAGRRFRLRPHVCKKKINADQCAGCNRILTAPDAVTLWETESEPPTIEEYEIFSGSNGESIDSVDSFWDEITELKKSRDRNSWMYICDTGSFWQSSFLTAINPDSWPTPVCTPEEYATILEGKTKRDQVVEYGDIVPLDSMRRYNVLENEILSRITHQICIGFNDIGIKIPARDWYGPGRAAQLWLTSVSKSLGKGQGFDRLTITDHIPGYALDAGRACYYGGWFEQTIHGHIAGRVHEYDINSAYPYVISNLPCLLHGTWEHSDDNNGNGSQLRRNPDARIRMLRVTVCGSDPYIGAMPCRSKQGRIYRPNHVTGWYWEHELDAAKRAGLIDTMDVHEWISYQPCACPPPLQGIAGLYQARLRVDKSSPQGRGYKLVYNSSYGKMAQSIGEPKFANSIYASLITAGCRALILSAIATHPAGSSAVTMVATDGIYFLSPHPGLELSKTELGKWTYETKTNLTQFMPGVYWDDVTRSSVVSGGVPHIKSRGINASDLARSIESLDDRFRIFADRVRRNPDTVHEWPTFDVSTSFEIVSCSQALQRRDWDSAGRVTKGKIRHIDSNPARKRDTRQLCSDHGNVRSLPYQSERPVVSVPYAKSFGQELADMQLLGESIIPDGDNNDYLAWMMQGTYT